jgi:hypothetical protein
MGLRDITNVANERTVIASVAARVPTGDTLLLMFLNPNHGTKAACEPAPIFLDTDLGLNRV